MAHRGPFPHFGLLEGLEVVIYVALRGVLTGQEFARWPVAGVGMMDPPPVSTRADRRRARRAGRPYSTPPALGPPPPPPSPTSPASQPSLDARLQDMYGISPPASPGPSVTLPTSPPNPPVSPPRSPSPPPPIINDVLPIWGTPVGTETIQRCSVCWAEDMHQNACQQRDELPHMPLWRHEPPHRRCKKKKKGKKTGVRECQ
ncbi:uncharacterized protein LOC134242660 [Saccostrea cucullata]|uniref:uncharacterized protein LOC134242660 n=1 Tax=Saccostrea cuccullata TaxID=36930 RepID=UPI002ED2941C